MPKRWIVIGLLMLFVGAGVGAAQEATQEAFSPALQQEMTGLEQITSTLRNLPIKQQIGHAFPTRQETIDYLTREYNTDLPPEQLDRLKTFYVVLGLLPPDIDLRSVYLNLLGSQVAGFYDPATKVMNVLPVVGNSVGSSLSFTEQIIYVHEFTHALQDQYFDLGKLLSPEIEALPDRSLAVTSLVEGDATSVMTLYTEEVTARNPLAALSVLVEGAQAGNLTLPPGIPDILSSELLFPYTEGMNFDVALYNHGGWDAVNAAFRSPPTTTEQIIHPDKYIAGEGAQDVVLPDESAALGSGWQSVWDTPLGEFYLEKMLATEVDTTTATQAAAGWGGDHLRIYRSGDQTAWALRLAWDSFTDSQEFHDAVVQYGDERFGGSPDATGCWQSADAAFCLPQVTAGPESLIVSAPTLAQAQALAGE